MIPQSTIENKPHCEICRGKGFHINSNEQFNFTINITNLL